MNTKQTKAKESKEEGIIKDKLKTDDLIGTDKESYSLACQEPEQQVLGEKSGDIGLAAKARILSLFH